MAPSDGVRVPDRGSAVDDESGAIILMAALILLVMLGMSAVVVDLAFMRHDKRASQTAADMGAIAGAFALPVSPHADSSGLPACQDAWAYVVRNSPIPNGAGGDPCLEADGDFDVGCVNDDPPPPNVAVGEVDPYRVTITWPVPPSMVSAQQDDAAERPCELVAVQVDRTRGLFFAGIWGLSEGFTTAPAVASMRPDDDDGIPALLVLDPEDCHALRAAGQGRVWVEYFEAFFDEEAGEWRGQYDPETGLHDKDAPGLIGVDSDASGSCGSAPYALDAGTSQAEVKAGVKPDGDVDGDIWIYALSTVNAHKAYRESNVAEGRVAPRPTSMFAPITRRPVDHRYNCKESYAFGEGGDPHDHPVEIDGCIPTEDDDRPRGKFIDELRDEDDGYGGSGSPGPRFVRYTDYMREVYGNNSPCQLSSGAGPFHLDFDQVDWTTPEPAADGWQGWWIDCPNQFRTLTEVVISGGDVVFDGDVRTGSDGKLYVNYDPNGAGEPTTRGEDVVVFLRDGDLTKSAQSTLAFNRAAVYIHDGRFDLGGGAQHGHLTWQAPLEGPFRSLALWSEAPELHAMEGQGDLSLRGVFFAPNARIEFTGQGGQINRANAQFLSFRLTVKGQGTLVLRPDPAESLTIERPGAELIR